MIISTIGGDSMYELQETEKLAYSIPEIAKLTGLSVSYLYRLSSEGKLPICKIGSRCLITSDDLNNWLREHSRANAIKKSTDNQGGNQG